MDIAKLSSAHVFNYTVFRVNSSLTSCEDLAKALSLNCHLAYFTLNGSLPYTCTIDDMYTKHIKLTQMEINLVVDCLVYCLSKVTWSIMVLTFVKGSHLENRITIKSIGVWWYLSHEIYRKNNWYVWEDEILATTKHIILRQKLCCK